MAKFKVLKKFRDKETKEVYGAKDEIEMTVKRADEVEAKLGKGYLERIEEEGKAPKENKGAKK